MNHCCLHVEVTLNVTPDEWLAACEAAVPLMRRLEGLEWKLWVLDREHGRAGGVYLFRDLAAASAYESGPVLQHLRTSPAVRTVETRLLPLHDALSRRTFGLVGGRLRVGGQGGEVAEVLEAPELPEAELAVG
jgi:hypothetical protein